MSPKTYEYMYEDLFEALLDIEKFDAALPVFNVDYPDIVMERQLHVHKHGYMVRITQYAEKDTSYHKGYFIKE